jgi:hypothetical protein
MRNTQLAEQSFRSSLASFSGDDFNDHKVQYDISIAGGLVELAIAVRDVYDKLIQLERKVDVLMSGVARVAR